MEKIPELCHVGDALEIIVGKWKPMILLVLLQEGTKSFSDLKRKLPDISQKMLTQNLRELEEEGIIERIVYPEVPPRVEYSISEYGRSLEPLLDAMHSWGVSHVLRKEEKLLHVK